MAKDLADLNRKMRYEVGPLLREYIKDGILQGREEDEEYFSAWEQGMNLVSPVIQEEETNEGEA